jgi:hypothetical protein
MNVEHIVFDEPFGDTPYQLGDNAYYCPLTPNYLECPACRGEHRRNKLIGFLTVCVDHNRKHEAEALGMAYIVTLKRLRDEEGHKEALLVLNALLAYFRVSDVNHLLEGCAAPISPC